MGYLIIDPPGDDGTAMEVDGASGVIASIEDDHGRRI